MVKKIDFANILQKRLEDDKINDFCCGIKEIDEFINEQALIFQKEHLGVTYLFSYKGRLVGFVTLSMADLKREKMEFEDRLIIGVENYPALLIGQLATQQEFQESGIGTYLCDFCLDIAQKISKRIGCRFLVVNAIKNAVAFYEKYGFKMLKEQKKRTQKIMFFNIF